MNGEVGGLGGAQNAMLICDASIASNAPQLSGNTPAKDVGKTLAQCATDNAVLLERVLELENADIVTSGKMRKLEDAAIVDAAKFEALEVLVKEFMLTTTTATTSTTISTTTATTISTISTTTTITTTTFIPGSQKQFTTVGQSLWTVPQDVTSISVVCIGGGGGGATNKPNSAYGAGGGGGALSYINDLTVQPGQAIRVTVGKGGGHQESGGHSFIDVDNSGFKVIEAPGGGGGQSWDWAGDAGPTSLQQQQSKKCSVNHNDEKYDCDWFQGGKGGYGSNSGAGPGGGGGAGTYGSCWVGVTCVSWGGEGGGHAGTVVVASYLEA